MNLDISWSVPSPAPTCGFKAQYRRKTDPTYTEVDTTGTTLALSVEAPASYEGKVFCDCCSESISNGVSFGINAYSLLSASAVVNNQTLTLTLSSDYSNPYDTLVEGNITVVVQNNPQVVPFSVTYNKDNTTQDFNLGASQGQSVDSTEITVIGPIFNGGGQLQQVDPLSTPPYFKFYYSGEISGNTWNGSVASLPSFTLDQFNVTELAVDGITPLAGQLMFSYILGTVFPNAWDSFSIEVYDPSSSVLVGSTILSKLPLGLRSEVINLTKDVSPLDNTTEFVMKVLWPDNTIFDVKTFYLPS